jgi:TolB-like protein/Tfp pilus assembly protein PilF
MNPRNFFAELKRRNVHKVAVAYVVVAWPLIQAASILLPIFEAPPWAIKAFVVVIVLGFPAALILPWAFEITPGGIKRRSEDVASDRAVSRLTGPKLIALTVVVAAIAAGLFAFQVLRPKPKVAPPLSEAATILIPEKSIAVLPFENLSDDKANAYFAIGIQDEIITKLAQLGQLRVISRTSTAKYQSRPENLRTVGRELGVATLLEGSVQKAGDDVRINVQLIDAQTDQHLWAQSYTRTLKNIFAVEAELAEKVAEALQLKLAPEQLKRLTTAATTNSRAHELYLRARVSGTHSDEANVQQQIALLREALVQDPQYSAAWAELVNAYLALADAYRPPLELLPAMQRAALKAIETDQKAGAGHASLGIVALVYGRDFPLAKRELELAVALDPNSSGAHLWYGWYLARVERDFARARAQLALARVLDPKSTWPLWRESAVALAQGDYEAALRAAEQLLAIEPAFFYDIDPIGRVYVSMGRWQDALRRYEALSPSVLPSPNFEMAMCYAHLGDTARARQILATLEKRAREFYVDKIHLAAIYAALGEKDNAFAALEQAAQERSARVSAPRFTNWLAPLFDDPRFAAFEYKIAHSAIVPSAEPASTP